MVTILHLTIREHAKKAVNINRQARLVNYKAQSNKNSIFVKRWLKIDPLFK